MKINLVFLSVCIIAVGLFFFPVKPYANTLKINTDKTQKATFTWTGKVPFMKTKGIEVPNEVFSNSKIKIENNYRIINIDNKLKLIELNI